jgi:two-component system response regulator PilR (NtrC family)
LLSATHKHLADEVQAGRFRNDLYYRINVIDVQVPALRDRAEDLPALATNVLQRISGDRAGATRLDESALEALAGYEFPGNVRELENILERGLALSEDNVITAADLQFNSVAPRNPRTRSRKTDAPGIETLDLKDAYGDLEGFLNDIERRVLSNALEEFKWNRTATAKALGVSFRSLRYRLQKLGLED